jgi:hypothetical protein
LRRIMIGLYNRELGSEREVQICPITSLMDRQGRVGLCKLGH